MTPCARRSLLIALFLFAVPAAALASGPPVGGWAEGGVVGAGSRYMALPAGRGTLLERLSVKSGRLLRTHYLKGHRGIPMVALDGTPGGLSTDGRTLVLSPPRTSYPQRTSTLYLMNARNLTLRRRITLRGDFSFDAQVFAVPAGCRNYSAQLDERSTLGLFMDVSAGFDPDTGMVIWLFISIDPQRLD